MKSWCFLLLLLRYNFPFFNYFHDFDGFESGYEAINVSLGEITEGFINELRWSYFKIKVVQ